ncbi:SPOR domain-containing protein [uncultured Photobacterium sp.]|uniref:SPOR domain-containing protein n=1 Tax=uncultured Photobacterium sp. TaxID=173973 RepID=UPI0026285386|nr:SPOR domain-containing protein [uncultured Photobacterium sp.]
MKKIITLSLLSSLVGCAQLMPPKTSLQTPIETINTGQVTEKFLEPTIVAEIDESVKTDPLYQSLDSIVVSEQVIDDQPVAKGISTTENSSEPAVIEEMSEVTTNADSAAVIATNDDSSATIDEPESIESTIDTTVDDQVQNNDPITDDEYKTTVMHGYSVQVTASRDEQSLVTLLSLLDSQQPAWLNKKMINGSQVYSLLLGHYSDHEQAKSALALLPEALQHSGAFVRNFYDIEHSRSPQLKQLQ